MHVPHVTSCPADISQQARWQTPQPAVCVEQQISAAQQVTPEPLLPLRRPVRVLPLDTIARGGSAQTRGPFACGVGRAGAGRTAAARVGWVKAASVSTARVLSRCTHPAAGRLPPPPSSCGACSNTLHAHRGPLRLQALGMCVRACMHAWPSPSSHLEQHCRATRENSAASCVRARNLSTSCFRLASVPWMDAPLFSTPTTLAIHFRTQPVQIF